MLHGTNSSGAETKSEEPRRYDQSGYDQFGYDPDGYDSDGFDELGRDIDGFDENELDVKGYNRLGFNESGFDRAGYDEKGYDIEGFDQYGYDRNCRDKNGYDPAGFDEEGYDAEGYDAEGYDKEGYDIYGYDIYGYDRDDYDEDGFDTYGINNDEYDDEFDTIYNSGYNQDTENENDSRVSDDERSLIDDLTLTLNSLNLRRSKSTHNETIARPNRFEYSSEFVSEKQLMTEVKQLSLTNHLMKKAPQLKGGSSHPNLSRYDTLSYDKLLVEREKLSAKNVKTDGYLSKKLTNAHQQSQREQRLKDKGVTSRHVPNRAQDTYLSLFNRYLESRTKQVDQKHAMKEENIERPASRRRKK